MPVRELTLIFTELSVEVSKVDATVNVLAVIELALMNELIPRVLAFIPIPSRELKYIFTELRVEVWMVEATVRLSTVMELN
jgi:hypothetical protein